MKVRDLFDVKYGINLELVNCQLTGKDDPEGINFVARTSSNNGVVAKVKPIEGKQPHPAGVLSFASGGSVCSTFVQKEPFYSGRDLYILTPLRDMSLSEKLYYCMCIRANKYRYSYGRQANKTLKDIDIPDTVPDWVNDVQISPITTKTQVQVPSISVTDWKWYFISDLFDVSVSKDPNLQNSNIGVTPYISSSAENNGITGYVDTAPSQIGNVLTIARNGSVGTTFYQEAPFCASPDDIRILTPKFEMTKYSALFIKTVIELEKYKYAYGRKLGSSRIKKLKIKLPALTDELPDFEFMENYIKALPYSDRI